MNKKMLCAVLLFILIININTCFANVEYINPNTNYKALIEDDADLLDDSSENMLLEQMKDLTQYGHIILKSITSNPYSSSSMYSENYYYSNFENASGTLLLVDMDMRTLIITSDGKNYSAITKSKANTITDNIYRYATAKDYYNCASEAFKQVEALLEGNKIAEPMKNINNGLLALTLSLLINMLFVNSLSKVKPIKEKNMLNSIEHYLNIKYVNKIPTNLQKVYSPQSDSSSSGFSSSGGGHSSGGGYHRRWILWRKWRP